MQIYLKEVCGVCRISMAVSSHSAFSHCFFGYNLPPNTFQAKRMEIKTFVSDILFSYLCFGCALCMANSSNSRVGAAGDRCLMWSIGRRIFRIPVPIPVIGMKKTRGRLAWKTGGRFFCLWKCYTYLWWGRKPRQKNRPPVFLGHL